jgi:Mce-associated membrane protein
MDLATLRPDGVTLSAADDPPPPARRSALLLVVAAIALLSLAAAAVALGVRDHRHRETDTTAEGATPTQQAALAAARGEAVALTTIGYRTASSDLDRVLAGATGALRTQFEKEKSQLPATLAHTRSSSRGTVLSSALSSFDGSHAQALVAVDATVSGTDTGSAGVLKHYRMVVSLDQQNGRWLASDVAFAGQPQ